jgi:hypothetical protein
MRLAMNVELHQEETCKLFCRCMFFVEIKTKRKRRSQRLVLLKESLALSRQHGVMNGQDAIKSFE